MELVIQSISKTYGNGVQALRGVSLTVPTGMFGLVGPNGSGKTTLMRSIATLQEVDEGSIRLNGIDVLTQKEEVRKVLGYLPQDFGVYPNINAESLLAHFAMLKGITSRKERASAVEALLLRTNLWNDRKRKLGTFSGGMRQRFGVAQALLGSPQLIIVDEPTAGLDPEERERFLNLLSEIGQNVVVILSTHIIEDVSELCTSMAIIDHGVVRYSGSPRDAIARIRGKTWERMVERSELGDFERRFTVLSKRLAGGTINAHVFCEVQPDATFSAVEPDLRDVYFTHLSHNGGEV